MDALENFSLLCLSGCFLEDFSLLKWIFLGKFSSLLDVLGCRGLYRCGGAWFLGFACGGGE